MVVAPDEPARLHLLLDADISSHALVRVLREHGHDVVAAGLLEHLKHLDDPVPFAVAQQERRVLVTHDSHDFPDILREWTGAARSHHGCIISFVATNAYGEIARRFERWFEQLPSNHEWIDRAVVL